MLLNEEMLNNENSFYSPLCKSKPYLTPDQRKKLREKRNIGLLPVPSNNDKPLKLKKKVKKLSHQKPKSKIIAKKALQKKVTKVALPEVCCTVAEWVPQSKTNSEKRRFFKTRSPEHLKKTKFVLQYKKSRLEFCDVTHSGTNDNNSLKSPSNSTSVIDELRGKMTENPYIVKVSSITDDFTQSVVLESTSSEADIRNNKTIDDKTFESSPTAAERNLHASESMSCSSSDIKKNETVTNKPKNYPIFDKESIKKIKWDTSPSEKSLSVSFRTKDKSKGGEQMIIDAGQNKIGAIMCQTCSMVYTIGHEEDEKLHSENHNMYLQLRFPGWKDERVIGNFKDGRVIKIHKDDKNFKLKKIQDILQVVNRELGFPSAVFNRYLQGQNVMVILFISNDKFVKGCLVAESITSASPVILHEKGPTKSYYASSETVRAICGINRIWVSRHNRKQKVASHMVDCLRSNFIHGLVISVEELAFTDPTEDGMQFAASYTGTDKFLVYK